MAQHTQTIRRLLRTNCWSVFDHFARVGAQEVNTLCPLEMSCKFKQTLVKTRR